MPRATVNTEATRHELNTCPGGFVMLRALPYGQILERREKASKMSLEQQTGRKNANQRIDFALMQQWTRQFEFHHCIIDHNLEDDKGNKLNFSLPNTLSILDPKIGAEIEKYIDELNQDEDDEDLDAFLGVRTPPSESEISKTNSD